MEEKTLNLYDDFVKSLEGLLKISDYKLDEDVKLDLIIKRYETTYEICWKILRIIIKKYNNNYPNLFSKEIVMQAYKYGIITNYTVLLDMVSDRNSAVPTYNKKFAMILANKIETDYIAVFIELKDTLKGYL